jgi:UDP-hydrolysing UDP-N-acetyl-D-glucosamine 2-epimerase
VNDKRKVCVVLTTRGNYAKMKSVIEAIEADETLELQLILGGMVVLEKYGRISSMLEEQGRKPARTINFVVEGENLTTMAKSSGLAMMEFSTAFDDLKPDVVIVIADRFECLPIAMAAAYMNIAVAHIEGGEVTGSIDESIRHAITKLAHLHFPASLEAAQRIERMGEDPASIHIVGASSMDVLRSIDLNDLQPVREYQTQYGLGPMIDLQPKEYLVVIQHPVTTEYGENLEHITETIAALEELDMPTVWVMPNMDAGSDGINKAIRRYRERERNVRTHFFKSLPIEYYGPLLKNALCILGNSSSGIREAAFLGTPSVNIGTRQNGRQRGCNVIDVEYEKGQIVTAVRKQIERREYAPDALYGDGYAAEKILRVLKTAPLNVQKMITY